MQADLNAAVNLALRAVAHPSCAEIHHRLRSERKKLGKGNKILSWQERNAALGMRKSRFCRERKRSTKERIQLLF